MDDMMMEHTGAGADMMGMSSMTGPTVFGFDLISFLMILAGVVYVCCAFFLWKPFREEKNELIGALFSFLIYQALSMFFMGIEMHTMNMLYGNIASLAVFIGSAYMLKFPLSKLSERTRKTSFTAILIGVLLLFIWFMRSEAGQMHLMNFTLWYDLVVNGVLAGGSILLLGLMTSERWLKIKAIGGGSGVVTCCVISNATMLSGALLTSSVFAFLAPILILGSLSFVKRRQSSAQKAATV
jgi:hypothetical protein